MAAEQVEFMEFVADGMDEADDDAAELLVFAMLLALLVALAAEEVEAAAAAAGIFCCKGSLLVGLLGNAILLAPFRLERRT